MGARLTFLLLALVVLLLPGRALASELPPAPTQHVTDTAGVMSEAARADLSARLAAYEAQTGHQIVAWIGRTSGELSTEELAVRAFEAWKVGREGQDDGVVLFVLVDDRKVRIEVGYGLEDRVTDLESSRIIRNAIVPHIVAGDFDAAIRSGVEAIADTIEGRPDALPAGSATVRGPPPERAPDGIPSIWMIVLGIAFLVLLVFNPRLALLFLWSMAGRHGGGGFGGGGFGGGGFGGGGGRSGGGGATGGW